ncbi:MAG: basic amino acid ABC transporter substrate-binding protein [Actinomycetota bacterium]|nr:basic amino acid ABC transporter substrate-binding protein [Actinomycetota bacterium]
MRKARLALTLVAAISLLAACAEQPRGGGETESPTAGPTETAAAFETLEEGILSVGSCLDYPPFESVKGGDEVGFDVDLSEEIANRLGLEVEWVRADFDTIFTAVAGGQFDMVAAASTITEERQQTVDFSDPYYNSRQALVVGADSDIASEADVGEGHIVGVQRGTTGRDYAEENLASQGAQIKTYTNAPDAFRDLEAGNIDAIVNDEPSSAEIIEKQFPDQLLISAAIDTNEKYGFAFSKDNPELTEAVNGALAEIIADGTYEEIFATYFPGVEVPPEFQGTA